MTQEAHNYMTIIDNDLGKTGKLPDWNQNGKLFIRLVKTRFGNYFRLLYCWKWNISNTKTVDLFSHSQLYSGCDWNNE